MKKKAVSIEQRRALRAWYQRQRPRPSQRACIEWFQLQFNHKLSQSTISDSLGPRFVSLDSSAVSEVSGARLTQGQWPDLENILLTWQLRIEQQGGVTSGDLLREKARQIWQQLPQYSNLPCPDFSSGCLHRFKNRHKIKQHTRHGEAGSVPEVAEEQMKALRTLAGEFAEQDVYNMDETGLFWRMTLSQGLVTASQLGIKKDKSRISLVFCVNANGSDRLLVWMIS